MPQPCPSTSSWASKGLRRNHTSPSLDAATSASVLGMGHDLAGLLRMCARYAWLIPASSGILKNTGYWTEASVVLANIVARPTTWWALKDISGMPLLRGNRQLVSSLTWRKHMRQPGNMASSETVTGLASEADCLFLLQNISGTGESESELGQHSLMNSTQRKVFQLAVSWLWHVLDWRLMSCPLVLPRTSSKHSLSMT